MWKNNKNIINLSSAESAQIVLQYFLYRMTGKTYCTHSEEKCQNLFSVKIIRTIINMSSESVAIFCVPNSWKRVLNSITKTCLCNVDPLEPHFYIVKLGFTGVYINFLISSKNINCRYSLEPPRRGSSNEYPQSMFWAEIKKNIKIFI